MPKDLPPEARPIWRALVPKLIDLGIVTSLDTVALGDMCLCIARLAACEKDITDRGVLVEGDRGKVKNPALQVAREYRTALQNWARRFGLTPGDRDRIEIPEDEDNGQSLADILMGHVTKESQTYADTDFTV
jgi:P27 family predicted phage terminase small subunit